MMQDDTHQFCIVEVSSEHCVQVPIATAVCIMVMGFAVSRNGFQGWQQSLCFLRRQADTLRRNTLPKRTCQELAEHM